MAAPAPIPQANPVAGYRARAAKIDQAIQKVLQSGHYILGHEVMAFEEEFAAYLGAPHCIGVASGTDALEVALRAVGIQPGDIVYTPAHTAVGPVRVRVSWISTRRPSPWIRNTWHKSLPSTNVPRTIGIWFTGRLSRCISTAIPPTCPPL